MADGRLVLTGPQDLCCPCPGKGCEGTEDEQQEAGHSGFRRRVVQVTAVHTEQPYGYSHPHIAKVRLSDGTVETRAQVITYIRQYKMTYVTYAPGVREAKVVVASCPHCGSGDYITTEPDYTEENNLLDLPKF